MARIEFRIEILRREYLTSPESDSVPSKKSTSIRHKLQISPFFFTNRADVMYYLIVNIERTNPRTRCSYRTRKPCKLVRTDYGMDGVGSVLHVRLFPFSCVEMKAFPVIFFSTASFKQRLKPGNNPLSADQSLFSNRTCLV